MDTSLSSERHGLLIRSLSLAEFSPSKASSAQQHFGTFPQSCSLIRHISYEQILLSPKTYNSTQKSVAESVNLTESKNEYNIENPGKGFAVTDDTENKITKGVGSISLASFSEDFDEKLAREEPRKQMPKRKNKKIRIRPLVENSYGTSKVNKMSCVYYILFPLIIIICGMIFIQYNSEPWAIPPDLRVCREVIPDVTSLQDALEKNIFGQQSAVTRIVELLRIFYTSRYPEVKVFALAGGVGVGKSYLSSLLSKHFPWQSNIVHLYWPIHHKEVSGPELYKKLSFCGVNLVVVDDIGVSQATNATELVKQVTEFCMQDHIRTIIVLVFNFLESQQDISYKQIENVISCMNHMDKLLTSMGLETDIMCFENLEEAHIKKCIEIAALEKGLNWSSKRTNEVLALLDPNTGCKGVNSKVQLLRN